MLNRESTDLDHGLQLRNGIVPDETRWWKSERASKKR
jgi:hypothetical protein